MKWFLETENGEIQEIDSNKLYDDVEITLIESMAGRYDEDIITVKRVRRSNKFYARHTKIDIGNYGLYSPTGLIEPEGMFLYN